MLTPNERNFASEKFATWLLAIVLWAYPQKYVTLNTPCVSTNRITMPFFTFRANPNKKGLFASQIIARLQCDFFRRTPELTIYTHGVSWGRVCTKGVTAPKTGSAISFCTWWGLNFAFVGVGEKMTFFPELHFSYILRSYLNWIKDRTYYLCLRL